MSRRIVAAALVIGLIGHAAAAEFNPKAIAQADEIKWRERGEHQGKKTYEVQRHNSKTNGLRRGSPCRASAGNPAGRRHIQIIQIKF